MTADKDPRSTHRTPLSYISWAKSCSRSDHTARELGGVSHMIYPAAYGSRPSTVLFKYAHQAILTLQTLTHDQPGAVFVMSPPPIAILPVASYCRRLQIPYVVDAHSGAFVNRRWRRLQGFQNVLLRRAVTTIVTNEHLAALVGNAGAHATIVPDVPVLFPDAQDFPRGPEFTVAVAASFNYDEPIDELLQAIRLLPQMSFLITGDVDGLRHSAIRGLPPNVILTGFLPNSAYGGLLQSADAVLALTTLDHTMLRGAYEAIYQGTPVVVSDWPVLRDAFPRGAVHVSNTAHSIAAGLTELASHLHRYRQEAGILQQEKLARWLVSKNSLLARIGIGAASPPQR